MKFVENVKPDVTTDIVYMMCPMHLLKLEEQIKELEEKTGNEFLGMEESADFYKFYIKKLAR
ncbi:MAG: SirA family protein [Nitrospirae bacterium]|nr:SirA family protein [Nitrospirota bacterium]